MRIALVAAPWLPVPPPAYGGSEGVIDRLATGFLEAGHDVLLFTTGDSTCPVPRAWSRALSMPHLMGQSI
ncbi:MAG TPA: glycosyltransferase family 4 protein, partial [Dermatophilaceae bacterium]|nr:glycosyltransferase family 4 protein [Dermatophilaceae bacterium]